MGSLDDLKILDFSTLLPGPYATLMLADMGAEVLKISSASDRISYWTIRRLSGIPECLHHRHGLEEIKRPCF